MSPSPMQTPAPYGSARRRRPRRSHRASAIRRDDFRCTRAPSGLDSWPTAFLRSVAILNVCAALHLTVLALSTRVVHLGGHQAISDCAFLAMMAALSYRALLG